MFSRPVYLFTTSTPTPFVYFQIKQVAVDQYYGYVHNKKSGVFAILGVLVYLFTTHYTYVIYVEPSFD